MAKKKQNDEAKELPTDRLWKVEDAIAYLDIPRSTFYMLMANGKIPKIKIGKHTRFLPEQIQAWAKKKAS